MWRKQSLIPNRVCLLVLVGVITLAVLAPLGPLATNRFHHDEAIYSSWGMDIASGRDVMISGSPVDKPPLFFYLQAFCFRLFGATEVAARLPSYVAHLVSVVVLCLLGRRLYDWRVGLLAAFLLAASPFDILFAATALTDSLMVAFVLLSCLAVTYRRWAPAGLALGLAMITKQQAAFFLPLVLGLGYVLESRRAWGEENPGDRAGDSGTDRLLPANMGVFFIALLIVLGLALGWDWARGRQPGFLQQSLLSYGDISLHHIKIQQRLVDFVSVLRYATGSRVLNLIFLAGLPLLLVADVALLWASSRMRVFQNPGAWLAPLNDDENTSPKRDGPGSPARLWIDMLLLGFCVLFLLAHAALPFRVWDRYLLGVVPLLVMLLSRILTAPWRLIERALKNVPRLRHLAAKRRLYFGLYHMALALLVTVAVVLPVRDAAASRFPIGGDHGAFEGIDQVVDYFQGVPADTTLYHRWLGVHWEFYMWGHPYDFKYWTSPQDLATQAASRPGANRYIVFPGWHSSTEARLALTDAGLALVEEHRVLRHDGSVSFVVYRIEEAR